jgi:hypothetical protein
MRAGFRKRGWGGGILALVLMLGSAPAAPAFGILFQNDLPMPVLVQGATQLRGMLRRGQPILILPGRKGIDLGVPLGLRQITIYDANQPNRILHRETILFQGQELRFRIQQSPAGGIQLAPLERKVPAP